LSGHQPAEELPVPLTTLAAAERRLILATLEHFAGDRRQVADAWA
jgi:hypothetical protein